MGRESMPHNIVILGGSYAGLAVAHGFLSSITRELNTFEGAPTYRVVLVSPSTHLYWNICAPRALVSPDLISPEETCIPIERAFARYPPNSFSFVQGRAIDIDTSAKRVQVELAENNPVDKSASPRENANHRPESARPGTISYHALIVATGSSSISPLFSLHGPHEKILDELSSFHSRVKKAKSILIIGGGPTGVETAAQFATYYKRGGTRSGQARHPSRPYTAAQAYDDVFKLFKSEDKARSLDSTPGEGSKCDSAINSENVATATNLPPQYSAPTPKMITLISGNSRLLPKLPKNIGKRAEKQLENLGIRILHNVRQISNIERPDGKFHSRLNNGIALTADILIEATGVYPNTRFVPKDLLDETGHIVTDSGTLRVFGRNVGERVYAVGSCADYAAGGTGDVYNAVPVLITNLRNDLLAHEYRLQTVASTPMATPLESSIHSTRSRSEHGPSVRYPISKSAFRPSPPQTRRYNTDSKVRRADSIHDHRRCCDQKRLSLPKQLSGCYDADDLPSPPRTNFPWPVFKRPQQDQLPQLSPVDSHQGTELSPHPPFFPPHHLNPLFPVPASSSTNTSTTLPRGTNRTLITPAEAYTKTTALQDAYYIPKPLSEVIPTSRYGGVGVIRGHSVSGLMVHFVKGRDWGMKSTKRVVERGTSVYGSLGKKE